MNDSNHDASALPPMELVPVVYDELRRLAGGYLDAERADHTLQPTALVHEVFLRLTGQRSFGWQNRQEFFSAAATVMRRILIDHARHKKAAKRGGNEKQTSLDEAVAALEQRDWKLDELDQALERLAELDERKSRVVELRVFVGLSVEETADALGISPRTVKRDWSLAKAWLWGELKDP